MAKKKIYTGDGRSLRNAVRTGSLRAEDFYQKMGISRGTLYNYYESADLDFSTKDKAAKILGRTIEDIFGQVYKDIGTSVAEPIVSYSSKKAGVGNKNDKSLKDDQMTDLSWKHLLQGANNNMRDLIATHKELTEAQLIFARTFERLIPAKNEQTHIKEGRVG